MKISKKKFFWYAIHIYFETMLTKPDISSIFISVDITSSPSYYKNEVIKVIKGYIILYIQLLSAMKFNQRFDKK